MAAILTLFDGAFFPNTLDGTMDGIAMDGVKIDGAKSAPAAKSDDFFKNSLRVSIKLYFNVLILSSYKIQINNRI
jgi:hypothetical protein